MPSDRRLTAILAADVKMGSVTDAEHRTLVLLVLFRSMMELADVPLAWSVSMTWLPFSRPPLGVSLYCMARSTPVLASSRRTCQLFSTVATWRRRRSRSCSPPALQFAWRRSQPCAGGDRGRARRRRCNSLGGRAGGRPLG